MVKLFNACLQFINLRPYIPISDPKNQNPDLPWVFCFCFPSNSAVNWGFTVLLPGLCSRPKSVSQLSSLLGQTGTAYKANIRAAVRHLKTLSTQTLVLEIKTSFSAWLLIFNSNIIEYKTKNKINYKKQIKSAVECSRGFSRLIL